MNVLTTAVETTHESAFRKDKGLKIGFVPTMGALHQGHISLVRRSKSENDFTVVSVFVNPNQFNNASDLEKYPRTFDEDKLILEEAGADLLFFPSVKEIYPQPDTRQFDFAELETVMEGKFRPGHFNGVAQVVSRLFDIVQPNKAYFGEKDFQQLAVIRAMTKRLDYDIEIVSCLTLREANGLAMSSRNERLSREDRERASVIYSTLKEAQSILPHNNPLDVKKQAISKLESTGFLKPEYFEISHGDTLQPAETIEKGKDYVICVAAWLGDVRLIDNVAFRF